MPIIPSSIKARDHSIRVHLAGPGYGEGLFIVIGGVIAIGIDCCSSFVLGGKSSRSFIREQMDSLPEDAYLFWILTHFHMDHFQGLSDVLNEFGDRLAHLQIPVDYTTADIFENARRSAAYDARRMTGSDLEYYVACKQAQRLKDTILKGRYRFKIGRPQDFQPWFTTSLIDNTDRAEDLSVDVYGPKSEDMRKFAGDAAIAFKDGSLDPSQESANRGSFILRIQLGSFEGLFFGDASYERIDQYKSSVEAMKPETVFVKVAHHGSQDGTSSELLRLIAHGGTTRQRTAFIAPFNNRLPNNEIVKMYQEHGFEVRMPQRKKSSKTTVSEILDEVRLAFDTSPEFGLQIEKAQDLRDDIIVGSFVP